MLTYVYPSSKTPREEMHASKLSHVLWEDMSEEYEAIPPSLSPGPPASNRVSTCDFSSELELKFCEGLLFWNRKHAVMNQPLWWVFTDYSLAWSTTIGSVLMHNLIDSSVFWARTDMMSSSIKEACRIGVHAIASPPLYNWAIPLSLQHKQVRKQIHLQNLKW